MIPPRKTKITYFKNGGSVMVSPGTPCPICRNIYARRELKGYRTFNGNVYIYDSGSYCIKCGHDFTDWVADQSSS